MSILKVDNYIITTPIIDIIKQLQVTLTNGKLHDVELSKDGTDIKLTCPNDEHDGGMEHDPDCHINVNDNNMDVPYGWFHCFACGAKGSFIHFVALCFSASDTYAKNWLIKNFGEYAGVAIELDGFIDISKKKKSVEYMDESILEGLQSWTPYLQKRRLNRDICNKFHVKYDPKFRQIVFPVYDKYGHLLMAPKRAIDTKIFYLDSSKKKPIYGLNVIEKNNVQSCMVVEGPIDMLTCWSHGIPAIATLGSPSIDQIELINNSCISNLYLAFDNDEAGMKFTKFVSARLNKRILQTPIILPMNRKDVNDLTDEEWEDLIKTYNL